MKLRGRRLEALCAGAALAAAGVVFAAATMGQSSAGPEQPVEFFHRVHAGERQIACEFCHRTALSADYAGMPSVRLCMTCHRSVIPQNPEIWKVRSYWELGQPIPWRRVYTLPGHVFFSHRAHTAAGHLSCATCHGDVQIADRLEAYTPLTMGWCLQCHRQRKASTECWTCHR